MKTAIFLSLMLIAAIGAYAQLVPIESGSGVGVAPGCGAAPDGHPMMNTGGGCVDIYWAQERCARGGTCNGCQALQGCWWNGAACIPGSNSYACGTGPWGVAIGYQPPAATAAPAVRGPQENARVVIRGGQTGETAPAEPTAQAETKQCRDQVKCTKCTTIGAGCAWVFDLSQCVQMQQVRTYRGAYTTSLKGCTQAMSTAKTQSAAAELEIIAQSQSATTIKTGESVSYVATIKSRGINGKLRIGVSNLPKGAKATLKSTDGKTKAVFAIATSKTTPEGTYTPLVYATDGKMTRTAKLALKVQGK